MESEVFLMQTVYTNLAEDEVCYYVTGNYSPEVVRSGFREYGWDTARYSKRFEIVDAYSPLVGASSTERFSVKDPESIESFDETISAINRMLSPGDMLMFSSLSSLFDHCSCEDSKRSYDMPESGTRWPCSRAALWCIILLKGTSTTRNWSTTSRTACATPPYRSEAWGRT